MSSLSRLALLGQCIAALTLAQVNVLNVNYDQQQTGANLAETSLTPQMNWSSFGKLGTLPVDGQVYAQPLYVTGVAIGGAKYNVLYVATMGNSVFAFDADNPKSAAPLWQVNLGPTVPAGLFNFTDVLPEIGILGTPVIDLQRQVLYVVADTLPAGAFSIPVFQLHALSLADGHEMLGGPVQIAASVPGTGAGSSAVDNHGTVAFDAFQQLQRPGLTLANGTVYIGFGSHADTGNYHGWLLGYDASTLQQTAVFNSSPNGRQSAFWHSGRAPAADGNGNIFAVTGNGDFDGVANFGESVLRLAGSDLSLLDWYTPQEWSALDSLDEDVGSTGAILIPNSNFLVAGGKSGMLFLVQDDFMGHVGPDTTSTVQGVQVNTWGMFEMALWSNPQASESPAMVYEFEPFGSLKAFQIVNNKINSTIYSQFAPEIPSAYCGLSLSANGGKNGIVWLTTGNYAVDGVPATLHALDATSLKELWSSSQNSSRDNPGGLAKFAPPTVVNGRVYVPTFSNAVAVYGQFNGGPSIVSPGISAVVNSASYLQRAVSPGELVTIFGANLGPSTEAAGRDGSYIADRIEGTQVSFGGANAPLLFASSTQINAVVPFGVTGSATLVQVLYQGQPTASAMVPVQPASPALFALDASGGGAGAILNEDGSVNSQSNPARLGSVVVLYGTGGGVTKPASVDGLLTPISQDYPLPVLPVAVSIGGQSAHLLYAGAAPGLVAGVMQINAVVPLNAQASSDEVVVTIGGYASPSAITVAVQ